MYHYNLLLQLSKRSIANRYKGSWLGYAWAILLPVFMLAIYTFVFSVVFQAKWGDISSSKLTFAAALFSGLIIYNFFADVLSAAPDLIVNSPNLVKKVVFPLYLISIADICSAAFRFFWSFIILLLFVLFIGDLKISSLLFSPLILIPFTLFLLGLSWLVSAIGVYLKDVKHFIGVLISMLLFLSPIFYPLSAIPQEFQFIIKFNPLTIFIDDFRNLLMFNVFPSLNHLIFEYCFGVFFLVVGFLFFKKTRQGFADVL